MVSELEIMKRHVRALFTRDDNGRLLRVNEPAGAEASRFFLGKTSAGNVWRFRHDVPESLTEQLNNLCSNEPLASDTQCEPVNISEYLSLLEVHSPVQRTWSGPAYFFPDIVTPTSIEAVTVTTNDLELLRPRFEDWVPDVFNRQPFLAVVREGHAVSVCCSVRITADAHEVGVETLNEYRGKGYASAVVAQWANEVRKLGSMPLYSTSWQNVASQSVARRLRLVQYGSDFHVT